MTNEIGAPAADGGTALSSAAPIEPASGLAANALQSHGAGPFWLYHAPNGERHVKGRNGKILFRYPAGQEALADAHCLQLQKRWSRQDNALRAAAPELYEALVNCLSLVRLKCGNLDPSANVAQEEARAALAKARGE